MSDGTDKLIKRILDDAKLDAEHITDEADEKASAVTENARSRVAEIRKKGDEQAKQLENDIVFLAKKNAELEAKKTDLAMRHDVIEKAFNKALSVLRGMDAVQTADFLKKVIFRETSGGETIHPTERNEKIISELLPSVNAMLQKENAKPLILGRATDLIEDGFIIEGAGYKKTCSYKEMLADLREKELGSIGEILF